jgi:hypothetical protein
MTLVVSYPRGLIPKKTMWFKEIRPDGSCQ